MALFESLHNDLQSGYDLIDYSEHIGLHTIKQFVGTLNRFSGVHLINGTGNRNLNQINEKRVYIKIQIKLSFHQKPT